MTTLHMETEKVHALAKKLDREGAHMLSSLSQTRSAGSRLHFAWQGGNADDFNSDLNRLLKSLENQIVALQNLSVRVAHEVDEWVTADEASVRQFKADVSRVHQKEVPRLIEDAKVRGHSEYILIDGSEREAYEGYLEGKLSLKEAAKFAAKDPFKRDYLQSSITFYKHEEAGKLALLDGQRATQFGDFTGSIGSLEASNQLKAYYRDGAFRADAKAELGAYLAKGTYSAELAGASVAAVGFLGAEAQATTGLAFDPAKGELGAKVKVETFAGAKAEGSISEKVSVAGVDGTVTAKGAVSYGIGATAKMDVGFSQGHLRSEIQLGATLGLGVEFGFNVDLNVQQAATSLFESGKDAVDWLFR